MRCNIPSGNSTLRSVRPLNDPYGSNELNKPLTDRYNAGVLDNPLEVTGLNPVEALILFRHLLCNCLNWKINCDDHSSLSCKTAVHI